MRPTPVDRATLDELFELARWAPNHNLTNPWRFRVLGPERSRGSSEAAGPEAAAKLDRAPTLVAASVVADRRPVADAEDRDAAACACYIVLLAAHDRGLGGYWRTPGVLRTPEGRAACGIPEDEAVLGLLHLARRAAPSRRPSARRSSRSSPTSPDARARRRPRRAGRRAVRRAGHRRRDHRRRRRARRRQPRLLRRAGREGRLRARDVVALEQARPRRAALPAELRPRPGPRGAARAPADGRAGAAPGAPAAADRARLRRRPPGPARRDRAEHVRRDGGRADPPLAARPPPRARRGPRRPRGLEPGAPPRDRRRRGRRAAPRARRRATPPAATCSTTARPTTCGSC